MGILVSYAALIGTAAAAVPGAVDGVERADQAGIVAYDDACTSGGPACEAVATVEDEPPTFATPAEVDCPAKSASDPAKAQAGGEDCSPPSIDFRYRVSRSPESERPTGALRPQRSRRNVRIIAACAGLPMQRGSSLAPSTAQPIAVYAVLSLRPPAAQDVAFEWSAGGPARTLEPLDRPPRS